VVKLLGKRRWIPIGAILPSRVMDLSKKLPDLNCEVQDLLLEVVDLKQEVPDLRSGGIPPI